MFSGRISLSNRTDREAVFSDRISLSILDITVWPEIKLAGVD